MYRIFGFGALLVFSTAAAAQPAADISCIATQASVRDALDAANDALNRATDFINTHSNRAGVCSDQFSSLTGEARQKLVAVEKAYNDGASACSEEADTMKSLNGALTMAQTTVQSLDSTTAEREQSCRDYRQSPP